MKEFIEANGGVIAVTLLVIVSFNLFLSGFKAALEVVKDKTKTEVDNKVHDFVSKLSGFLTKILDMVGYNPKH